MKRIISLFMVTLLTLGTLVGCGGKNTTEEVTSKNSEEQNKSDSTESNEIAGYFNYGDFTKEVSELTFAQSPMLDGKELPDVSDRLPDEPLVFRPLGNIGNYGGTLTYPALNIDQDWNLRHMNSAYLFELDPAQGIDSSNSAIEVEPKPGIFESWDYDKEGYWFEFTIRKGLKWSDGEPVTTEDIKFCIEDVLKNKEIYPTPLPWLNWKGKETKISYSDDYTYRVEFEEPYGAYMLKELRVWNAYYGRTLYPAHYMEKYHIDYADESALLADMEEYGFYSLDEWGKYFLEKKVGIYTVDYVGLPGGQTFPTLDPWMPVEDLGNGNYLYERNPYYYMVDSTGQQLPYIDKLKRSYVGDMEVMNMEIISGKVDMASANLGIENYPLYAENEEKGNYNVLPLPAYQDHDLVYTFNFAPKDEAKREIFNDIRFRQAVSSAFDRETMNEVMYLGLGRPAQVSPRPSAAYFEEGMDTSYIEYDPEAANTLLDDMGMKDVDGDGIREDLKGEPFVINMDWFVVSGSSKNGAEYMKRYLSDIGIKVNLKQIDPSYYWGTMWPNNDHDMALWWLAGAGADTLEGWFINFMIGTPLWWNWANYYYNNVPESEWAEGKWEEPPTWAKEVLEARFAAQKTASTEERVEYAKKMWSVQAEQLITLGICDNIKMPFVISKDIGNVTNYESLDVPSITVLEQSEGWYFTNSERR